MDFARSTLKAQLKEQLAVVRHKARARRLRAEGFHVVNPYFEEYGAIRGRALRDGLAEILQPLVGSERVGVLLEIGCGDGRRVTPVLKAFAREVWGVDLLPSDAVTGCDQYFVAAPNEGASALRSIADNTVDLVLVLNLTGLHPGTRWSDYTDPANDRLSSYLGDDGFARIVRPGGHLVLIEWEAQPEQRVGRRTLAEVNAEIAELYGTANVTAFRHVRQGFAERLASPYVVLQRN
jgi:hypothetical protein